MLSVGVIAGAGPRDAGITLEDLVSSDGIATPTLSPGGREFAFTSDGQIELLAVDGGWPVVLTTTGALFLSQEGFVVIEPNYRGSSGYGEKFRNLTVEDSGGGELDDVVAGARYVVDNGLADRKRLGIAGGSHGGTMVAYAITIVTDLRASPS